jgi:DNA-directed RNA polymerase specialized sigma24 family protein
MSKKPSPGLRAAAHEAGDNAAGRRSIEDAVALVREACATGIRWRDSDPEDNAQSVWIRLLEADSNAKSDLQTLVQGPGFEEMVRRAVVAHRSLLRRRWSRTPQPIDGVDCLAAVTDDGPATVDANEYAAWLITRAGLSQTERAFVALHLVGVRSVEAIAEQLGIPPPRVAHLRYRALSKLRNLFKEIMRGEQL